MSDNSVSSETLVVMKYQLLINQLRNHIQNLRSSVYCYCSEVGEGQYISSQASADALEEILSDHEEK